MGETMRMILEIMKTNKDKAISGKAIKQALEGQGIYLDIKTIYAHIRQINAFFMPLLHEEMIVSIHSVGFVIAHDYFEDGQLQLLVDAIRYNKDLTQEEGQELIDKLIALSSAPQQARLLLEEKPHDHKNFSLMLNLTNIMKAIDNRKNISFEYVDYEIQDHHPVEVSHPMDAKKNRYIVSPYAIVLDNNHYYLIAYFAKRKERLSMYRIDRMRIIQTSKGTYIDIQEQYDMENYIKNAFNMFLNGKNIDLIIDFEESILREVVSRFGESIEIKALQEKWYEAKIKDLTYTRGLLMWLLMMGARIKVKAPLEVKEDLIKELQETMYYYA